MKYPNVKVKLVGEDGNAFFIIGRCRRAAKVAGVPADELEKFTEECMSGDYPHLLRTVTDWFDIGGETE